MQLEEKGDERLLHLVQAVSNLADVHYIRQKEPLGLGHAILCARNFIGDEPFAVLLGDDIIQSQPPTLKGMMELFEETERSVIAVQEVAHEDVSKYGIISPSAENSRYTQIKDLVEKPDPAEAPSNLAVIGRYIISPEIFDILERQKPGRGGEIQLTDALRVLNRDFPMAAFPIQGKRYDVGDKFGYIEATIELALQRDELGDAVKQYLTELVKKWN